MLEILPPEDAYFAAWDEWEGSWDAGLWETTASDGIDDATR